VVGPLQPPEPPLADDVLGLRAPDEGDLPAIERGLRDFEVVRAFGAPSLTASQLLDLNRRRWADGEAATFAVCDDADSCLGHVFVNLGVSRRATVGYWLLPEARGKGLATRALALVSRWALTNLDLDRLGLLTEVSNSPSQGVAERVGFHREGVLRSWEEIDERRVDYVSFSLLPSDL
jgi:[ribosomal protein S5]-alanine N-acetyltransferase